MFGFLSFGLAALTLPGLPLPAAPPPGASPAKAPLPTVLLYPATPGDVAALVDLRTRLRLDSRVQVLTYDPESAAVQRAAAEKNHPDWLVRPPASDSARMALARALGASFYAVVSPGRLADTTHVELVETAPAARTFDWTGTNRQFGAHALESQVADSQAHPAHDGRVAEAPPAPAGPVSAAPVTIAEMPTRPVPSSVLSGAAPDAPVAPPAAASAQAPPAAVAAVPPPALPEPPAAPLVKSAPLPLVKSAPLPLVKSAPLPLVKSAPLALPLPAASALPVTPPARPLRIVLPPASIVAAVPRPVMPAPAPVMPAPVPLPKAPTQAAALPPPPKIVLAPPVQIAALPPRVAPAPAPPVPPAAPPPPAPVKKRRPTAEDITAIQPLLAKGDAALDGGDTVSAIAFYRQAVNGAPLSVVPRLKLADAYQKDGLGDRALDEARRALEIAPDSGPVQQFLSNLDQQTGTSAGSLIKARAVLAQAPSSPAAHEAFAEALWNGGDLGGAEAEYKAASALAPGGSRSADAQLAQLYAAEARYDDCLAILHSGGAGAYATAIGIVRNRADTLSSTLAASRSAFAAGKSTREQYYDDAKKLSAQAQALAEFVAAVAPPAPYKLAHLHRMLSSSLLAQESAALVSWIETGDTGKSDSMARLEHAAATEMLTAQAAEERLGLWKQQSSER